ncbi:MAG: hypothetical protein HOP02_00645 [Methylococcaceae bacterium]|nr:hypothetical protein [Methylococcaceae bacterium]
MDFILAIALLSSNLTCTTIIPNKDAEINALSALIKPSEYTNSDVAANIDANIFDGPAAASYKYTLNDKPQVAYCDKPVGVNSFLTPYSLVLVQYGDPAQGYKTCSAVIPNKDSTHKALAALVASLNPSSMAIFDKSTASGAGILVGRRTARYDFVLDGKPQIAYCADNNLKL